MDSAIHLLIFSFLFCQIQIIKCWLVGKQSNFEIKNTIFVRMMLFGTLLVLRKQKITWILVMPKNNVSLAIERTEQSHDQRINDSPWCGWNFEIKKRKENTNIQMQQTNVNVIQSMRCFRTICNMSPLTIWRIRVWIFCSHAFAGSFNWLFCACMQFSNNLFPALIVFIDVIDNSKRVHKTNNRNHWWRVDVM